MSRSQAEEKKPVTVKVVLLGKLGVGKSGELNFWFSFVVLTLSVCDALDLSQEISYLSLGR